MLSPSVRLMTSSLLGGDEPRKSSETEQVPQVVPDSFDLPPEWGPSVELAQRVCSQLNLVGVIKQIALASSPVWKPEDPIIRFYTTCFKIEFQLEAWLHNVLLMLPFRGRCSFTIVLWEEDPAAEQFFNRSRTALDPLVQSGYITLHLASGMPFWHSPQAKQTRRFCVRVCPGCLRTSPQRNSTSASIATMCSTLEDAKKSGRCYGASGPCRLIPTNSIERKERTRGSPAEWVVSPRRFSHSGVTTNHYGARGTKIWTSCGGWRLG